MAHRCGDLVASVIQFEVASMGQLLDSTIVSFSLSRRGTVDSDGGADWRKD